MCWLKTTSSQILCEIMTLKVITPSNLEPDTRIISLVKQHHHITSDDHMIHAYQALMPRGSLGLAHFIAMLTSLKSTLFKQRKKWMKKMRNYGGGVVCGLLQRKGDAVHWVVFDVDSEEQRYRREQRATRGVSVSQAEQAKPQCVCVGQIKELLPKSNIMCGVCFGEELSVTGISKV